MTKQLIVYLIAGLTIGMLQSAQADDYSLHPSHFSGFTLNVGAALQQTQFDYNLNGTSDSFKQVRSPVISQYKLGIDLTNVKNYFLGINLFVLTAQKPLLGTIKTTSNLTISQDIKRNAEFGIILSPGYMVTPNNLIYVNLGYGQVDWQIDTSVAGAAPVEFKKTNDEYLAGLGYEVNLMPHLGLYLEANVAQPVSNASLSEADTSSSTYSNILTGTVLAGLAIHF
jgi:opacity protein-like surface antigen